MALSLHSCPLRQATDRPATLKSFARIDPWNTGVPSCLAALPLLRTPYHGLETAILGLHKMFCVAFHAAQHCLVHRLDVKTGGSCFRSAVSHLGCVFALGMNLLTMARLHSLQQLQAKGKDAGALIRAPALSLPTHQSSFLLR